MIQVTPQIAIDENSISEDFIRASGPGGQNVNKVSSSVVLRFDIEKSGLPPEVAERLGKIAAKRIASDGILSIKSQVHRTQAKNREDARERLVVLIQEAALPPVVRKATKPTRASKVRTLDEKRRRGEVKKLRKKVAADG